MTQRKMDPYWAGQLASSEVSADKAVPPTSKMSRATRATLAWVLGFPFVFLALFIASMVVHDPAKEQGFLYIGGTSKAENVLFVLGLVGTLIWLVGCPYPPYRPYLI